MTVAQKFSWTRLSLTAKVLLLLAVPLCLQLGFGIVLIRLQQAAEIEVQRANEARTIETEIDSLLSDLGQLFVRSQRPTRNTLLERGYKGYLTPESRALARQVHERYSKLEELTKDKPELHLAVDRSFGPFKEVAKIIDQANADIVAGNIQRARATSTAASEQMSAIGNKWVSQDLLVAAQVQGDLATGSIEKQAAIRRTTANYALMMILADVAIFIFLAIFWARTMTSRLRTMTDNAVKLAAHRPLNPPLPGADEIVELDHIFHNMAQTIDESVQSQQELYNIVTQDLRTPLIAIQECLEMLEEGQTQEISGRARKLITIAGRNSTRTIGLVNDLLDSQKVEAGMLELDATTVRLKEVFDDVNQDLCAWIEENGLQISFASTDLMVSANQNMLSRILFNLISNAIKYSPRGGTIAVQVKPVATMAEITVSDQGPGIPQDMLKAVFDRFRQVSTSQSGARLGTGLGLSICQDFVHLHGGEIWATSETGHGSIFHFTMPLA